jgi:hypothetical protein
LNTSSARTKDPNYHPTMQSSSNTGGQQQATVDNTTAATSAPLPQTPDLIDNTNSERLKQQTQRVTHSNGLTSTTTADTNPSSSNGHETASSNGSNPHTRNRFISSATQTVLTGSSYPPNGNLNSSRIFTNSQKEVLRLIGQHLQSVGLK